VGEQQRLGQTFLRACAEHGTRRAVVGDGEKLTYAGLAERVRERARTLDSLLRPDEHRIAIHAANSVDYLVSYYALVISRRLPFLVDAQFGAVELEGIRASCGIDSFLVEGTADFPLPTTVRPVPGSRHALAAATQAPPAEPPAPHPDTVTCRFTSGTTGAPKCLEFSSAAVHNAARNWAAGTELSQHDRVLCLAAFTNGLAFNTSLLPVFLVGAELHLYRGAPTSGGIARAVRQSRATRLVAFPLAYQLLAHVPQADVAAFSTLTRAVSAAAVLDPYIGASFEARYGVRIADYYGIAETGPCTFERDPENTTSLGTALPGVSLRIVERPTGEPEVRVRTASMATGYLNAPGALEERIDQDGFYCTGDCGRLDEGRLLMTGRIGGPINLAGRKIDPTEIERAVRTLDGVADTVVFADSDANGGAVLHVVVSGARQPARAEVVQVCRENLAPYKVPGRVSYLPTIPRSATGKVRLIELAELVKDRSE